MDGQQAAQLLDRDPYVNAWTCVSFETLRIDGHTLPILGWSPKATVAPPLLSGHALDAPLANVIAAIPGRIAGRTPAALLLRNE
jgi:hypothetical protein